MSDLDRFMRFVNKTDTCWLWTGFQRGKGYGGFQLKTGAVSAHRFAYENLVGDIPAGKQIDHLCMVKLCVNPNHLEPVTSKENNYRAYLVRGYWPVEGREKRAGVCPVCLNEFETIFFENKVYCSNACKCKAQRLRKKERVLS